MDEREKEIEHYQALRATYVQNRRWLEQQQANYAFSEIPLRILNELQQVRDEITRIDHELLRLGGISQLPSSVELLERITQLENKLTELQKKALPTSQYPPGFSWDAYWHHIYNGHVYINDRVFSIADILGPHQEIYVGPEGYEEAVKNRVVASPDDKFVALLSGPHYLPIFYRGIPEDVDWVNAHLQVFKYRENDPKFTSDPHHYVYSGPVFSSDSRYIALTFASDWHPVTHTYTDLDGTTGSYEVVAWNEYLALINTDTWGIRILASSSGEGRGEWATPINFLDVTFINHDATIFAISSNARGVIGVWNISLEEDNVEYISNPFFG